MAPARRSELSLQYTNDPPIASPPLPDRLRVVPAIDAGTATASRVISFSQGLINNRTTDVARVDQ